MPEHFADRLAALVEERRSRVVLGLDPDPAKLWPGAVREIDAGGAPGDAAAEAAEAVAIHCRAAIEAAGPSCVAVKPQLACFERLGAAGLGRARTPPATRPTRPGCWCWPTASAATCP